MPEVARTTDPDGRSVVLTEDAWRHIQEHVELIPHLREITEAISHPLQREHDPQPQRERFYGQRHGSGRWLRVVVAFHDDSGEVVTAFWQDEEP